MNVKKLILLGSLSVFYLVVVYQIVGLAYSVAPFLQELPPNLFVGLSITIGVIIAALINQKFIQANNIHLGIYLGMVGVCYMLWPDPSRSFNNLLPIINLVLFLGLPILVCAMLKKFDLNN